MIRHRSVLWLTIQCSRMVPDGTGVASLIEWMFTAVLVHGCVLGAQSTHSVQMLSSKCLSLVRLHTDVLL